MIYLHWLGIGQVYHQIRQLAWMMVRQAFKTSRDVEVEIANLSRAKVPLGKMLTIRPQLI